MPYKGYLKNDDEFKDFEHKKKRPFEISVEGYWFDNATFIKFNKGNKNRLLYVLMDPSSKGIYGNFRQIYFTNEEVFEINRVLQKREVPLDLSLIDLSGCNLRGIDFSGIKLDYSVIRYADLSYANLRNIQANNSNWRGIDLSYSDLTESNLQNSNLDFAMIKQGILKNSDLRNTTLSRSNLTFCNLRGADLKNSLLNETKMNGADIKSANFSDARFYNIFLNTLNGQKLFRRGRGQNFIKKIRYILAQNRGFNENRSRKEQIVFWEGQKFGYDEFLQIYLLLL